MLLKSGLFKTNLHQMVDGLCTTPRHQKIYTNSFMSDLFYWIYSSKNNAINKVLMMTKITHYIKLLFTVNLSSKYNFLESVNHKYYINRSWTTKTLLIRLTIQGKLQFALSGLIAKYNLTFSSLSTKKILFSL